MDFWISFANFFASAIRLTAPIALGTLACTISERAGVINIGIEGSMLFSGFLAAVGSYYTGSPWVGLLCGCAAGAFLALILGVLAIYCNGQQIVIGIGLNLFGPGFAYMLMRALWDTTGISPWVEGFQAVNIPLLSRIPIAGTMLSGYPACIYLGLLAVAVMQYLLHRTAWGLRIRAVGENPNTADAAGINVTKYKYVATCAGSMIAGLGGLYYVMDYACGVWSNNGFGDRGWLAIALVIFTVWRPNIGVFASFLFGGLYILHMFIPSGMNLAVKELYKMLPYVITILVLVIVSMQKKRENDPPASLGLSYFREER
mgnify:CR=1 FL=1